MNYLSIFNTVLLHENKDRFIDKNESLTFEQKQEVKDFFNKYPNYESHSLIRDKWQNGNWDYSTFLTLKKDFDDNQNNKKIKKSNYIEWISQNLGDFEESQDYSFEGNSKGLSYYIPYDRRIQREVFQKRFPTRWCIGSPNSDGGEWQSYIFDDDSIFVNIISDKDALCLQIFADGRAIFWNRNNRAYAYRYVDDIIKDIQNGTFEFVSGDTDIYDGYCPGEDDNNVVFEDNAVYAKNLDAKILSNIVNRYSFHHLHMVDELDDEGYTFKDTLLSHFSKKDFIGVDDSVYVNSEELEENNRLIFVKSWTVDDGDVEEYIESIKVCLQRLGKSEEDIEEIEELATQIDYKQFEFVGYYNFDYDSRKVDRTFVFTGYSDMGEEEFVNIYAPSLKDCITCSSNFDIIDDAIWSLEEDVYEVFNTDYN